MSDITGEKNRWTLKILVCQSAVVAISATLLLLDLFVKMKCVSPGFVRACLPKGTARRKKSDLI